MPKASQFAGKLATAALATVEALALVGFVYLAAAAFGSAAGRSAATPVDGRQVEIFVVNNGYHVDLALPAVDEVKDWRPLLAASPVTAGGLDAAFVAFGWGSRVAYTEIGTLADLSLAKMARALAFDATVMHVIPAARVNPGPGAVSVRIAAADYVRLVREVEASFAAGPDGAVVSLPGATQGYGDGYFEARGRFSPLKTCNVWAGETLKAAGVPVGLWTPFATPLMGALR